MLKINIALVKPNPELYISIDIEANGPIPGEFSMLSFGAAAFLEDGTLVDTFERNLEELDGAKSDVETMKWWSTQPEAWELCRKNPVPPKQAMEEFSKWVHKLQCDRPCDPVFVGYPASFDFTFFYWYLIKFTGKSPFSFNALDIKSFGMAMLDTPFRATVKKAFPNRWKSKRRHTHEAIEDALGQGELFINMLKENRANRTALKTISNITKDIKSE